MPGNAGGKDDGQLIRNAQSGMGQAVGVFKMRSRSTSAPPQELTLIWRLKEVRVVAGASLIVAFVS